MVSSEMRVLGREMGPLRETTLFVRCPPGKLSRIRREQRRLNLCSNRRGPPTSKKDTPSELKKKDERKKKKEEKAFAPEIFTS